MSSMIKSRRRKINISTCRPETAVWPVLPRWRRSASQHSLHASHASLSLSHTHSQHEKVGQWLSWLQTHSPTICCYIINIIATAAKPSFTGNVFSHDTQCGEKPHVSLQAILSSWNMNSWCCDGFPIWLISTVVADVVSERVNSMLSLDVDWFPFYIKPDGSLFDLMLRGPSDNFFLRN